MKITKTHAKGMVVLHSLSLLIVLFAFAAFVRASSEELTYRNHEDSRIAVSGFSNLDNWKMETNSLQCDGSFIFLDGELEDISSLTFSTLVKSLKSNHTEMDSIVHETLSARGAKEITFVQTQQMVLPRMKMVNIIGNLTIANLTRRVDLQLGYTMDKDKALHFKGLKKIDLNEFGITRSHPLLKALKFDNQVMIQIEMTLNNKPKMEFDNKSQIVAGTE